MTFQEIVDKVKKEFGPADVNNYEDHKIAKVGVFGFSTNSSAACLPLNTRTCLDELGCSQEITSFVLPTGMTINMNGTTVMHMFAVTFIATASGIDVTPANLITVAFLSICAAMGCPAIPIAGTTLIVTILSGTLRENR